MSDFTGTHLHAPVTRCQECELPTSGEEPQNHQAGCCWHDSATCPPCAEIGPDPVVAEEIIELEGQVVIRWLKHRLA